MAVEAGSYRANSACPVGWSRDAAHREGADTNSVITTCERSVRALRSATYVRPASRISGARLPETTVPAGKRTVLSRGLATVLVATVGLFAASLLFASSSVTRG